VTALRCSDYLGILFKWDSNAICFDDINDSFGFGVSRPNYVVPQAKNLVLETMYSIAYRIQQLLTILCYEITQNSTQNDNLDPAIISCALWIIYASLNCLKKLKWDARSLQNLVIIVLSHLFFTLVFN